MRVMQGARTRLLEITAAALLLALCCAMLPRIALAQAGESGAHPAPNALHFYLITVDVGDSVWDNFGHSALRVVDEVNGTDTVYNWGVFEVRGGPAAFAYDFFMDELQYRLATQSLGREIDNYRAQQRSVWQDELMLSAAQKQRLLVRLRWNRAAENIYYDYHYFFDNCTTRIRDYLDEVLDGRLAYSLEGLATRTFRDEVRAHMSSIQVVRFALDVLMNGDIDRPMTRWESLFLPLQLRDALAGMESDVTVGGQRLPLLAERETLLAFDSPRSQQDFYATSSVVLWLMSLFFLALLRRERRLFSATHARLGFRAPELTLRLFGLLSIVLLGASGIFGTLMLGSWFASGHTDLYHNVNLLLFWPTDAIGVVAASKWLAVAKPWSLTHNSKPIMVYYLSLKLFAACVYCVIMWSGFAAQDGFDIALFLVPCLVLLTVVGWIVGFDSARRFDAIG